VLTTVLATMMLAGSQVQPLASTPEKPVPGLSPVPASRRVVSPALTPDQPAQGTRGPILKSLAKALKANDVKGPARGFRPVKLPLRGVVRVPPAVTAPGDRPFYSDGRRFVRNASVSFVPNRNKPLWIPRHPGKAPSSLGPQAPSLFYGSTQVDGPSGTCTQPFANEASVAQSSVNPSLILVGAQAYADSSGCSDAHPWVYYSRDGGQHWAQQLLPNLLRTGGGDSAVAFDPVHNVFVYSYLEFNRDSSSNPIDAFVATQRSFDLVNWGSRVILDQDATCFTGTPCGVDKDMITVDQNLASPRYGRVAVTWTEFGPTGQFFFDAISDTGGAGWTYGSTSINYSSSNCGNGTSPAFDAAGELMTAWWDCNGGTSLREELSADGGATWTAPADTTITAINDIGTGTTCSLNAGGTAFRCNSFPSLAGDPNPADEGTHAFAIAWANLDTPSDTGGVAVAEIRLKTTISGGSTWDGNIFISFFNHGDKFFPWASFAPNGRLSVSYSDREDSATVNNPHGSSYNEHYTEACGLSRFYGGCSEFLTFTADGTLASPGGLTFIGDYSGQTSADLNFDTFPVWTDVRGGSANVRTQDVCYLSCYGFLSPYAPVFRGFSTGSTFQDFWEVNLDSSFGGSGSNFWNAIGIREGADGATIDDDMFLSPNRYYSSSLTASSASPPYNDYVLINANLGHAASTTYFPQVHSYSTLGGAYSVEWAAGNTVLSTSATGGMSSSNVVRVYDVLDNASTTYFIGLRPSGGNTSVYSLAAHLINGGDYQGRGTAVTAANRVAVGSPAFITFTSGTTAYDGVVVMNDNGGSGSYTLYRDTVAPTGSVSINGGATYTKSTSATLSLSASNATAGDPVLDMRLSRDGVMDSESWVPFSASSSLILPSGDGPKTVLAQFRNGAGAISAVVSDSIVLDQAAPTITKAPAPAFVKGKALGVTSAPIKVSWNGADNLSGINHYDLQESVDGGSFATVATQGATTKILNLDPGHSYRFRVRATDNAGNVSGFSAGSTFTLSAYQETSGSIAYSGGWRREALAGAYGGSVKFSTAAGKTADFTYTGKQVAWVSTMGSDRGSADITVDGGSLVTVNTNSASTKTAVIVYATKKSGTHTVRVSNDGTAGQSRIDIDAFLVIS